MKAKKLLSIMLAIIMVVSMMATMGISANAGKLAAWIKVEKYGKTFWYRTDKVTHNDGEYDESWECECWDLIVGKFAYAKPDEYDDGDWYDVYPCEHLVEYEPLTSLSMKSNPTKTTYAVGDTLDLTGAKVTATTISETVEDVNITSSMVSGFDSTTAGKKTVTVKYRNLTTSFDVIVAPQNECYLDLDSTTTDIKDNKELDQNYNLTVTELPSTSNAVTKVKLSWEIKDINAVRMDNKVWDTTELKWVVASSNTTIMDNGTAKFKLENYSSVMINASATFEALDDDDVTVGYDETTGTDGEIIIDTANGSEIYSKTNVPSGEITVTVTPSSNYFNDKTATTTSVKYGTYTVTIEEYQEEPACIASGAMVTLADGSKKVIDDLTTNDYLLTYNFFTGEIEGNKPLYIIKNDNILSSVITLSFSDGSKLEMCDEQSFFDMNERDYILISRKNYKNAIGKNIMQLKDGKIETVVITNATLEKKYCTSYELATENAVNFAANDIINTPPEYFVPGTYTIGEDMKVDAEQYQKDVEKYGLYTYADFEKYITENTFITGHISDVKIAVGKGLISEEYVFDCYEEWVPVIHNTNK